MSDVEVWYDEGTNTVLLKFNMLNLDSTGCIISVELFLLGGKV